MIIIIGIAGAGKSTQGQMLAKRMGCTWLSVGQMLRENVDKKLKSVMIKGQIVGDEIMLGYLEKELQKFSADQNELILDGAPRTLYQAKWLVDEMKRGNIKTIKVIHLKASKDVVKERLLKRDRQDDTEVAINQRFNEYDKAILPILDYLKSQGVEVYDVNGNGPPEEDAEAIDKALGTAK